MNYVIKTLQSARRDIHDISDWYEEQRPGLGQEFLTETVSAIDLLAHTAERHSIRFGQVRRAPIKRFRRYGIYYVLRKKTVEVVAIFHSSRNPERLFQRLNPRE